MALPSWSSQQPAASSESSQSDSCRVFLIPTVLRVGFGMFRATRRVQIFNAELRLLFSHEWIVQWRSLIRGLSSLHC